MGSLLIGCDVCKTNDVSTVEEGDIYFSAFPVSGTQPSIFRISADGKNLREILKNGTLYSPPSTNKKMVFLQQNANGVNVVFLCDIDGRNVKKIGDDVWGGKAYPILSPDGKKVTVSVGSKDLWLITDESNYVKITNKLCPNSLPVFSPDGTKLAFYEGYDLTSKLVLKVVDLNISPPTTVINTELSSGIGSWNGEATIDWSVDGGFLTYIASSSPIVDSIKISPWDNPDNSKDYEIAGFGAFQPVLSPDRQKVAFAGSAGNIWIRNLLDNTTKYINVSGNSSQINYNIYAQWSLDGKSIIFSKYYKDDPTIMHATLEIANVETDKPIVRVLSNNVYRGFWNRKKF